jgi:hypothetical protein
MKASHILSFTLFTFNIVWGKPGGDGAPTSWLIGLLVVDLPPTGCTRCSMAKSPIFSPVKMVEAGFKHDIGEGVVGWYSR